ncbi:MAG: cobalamin-independent methionine synthase II family protein [Chloroflexi bacterium]|nr:cobalamin-independent methionine synthase II family protein [Chloroflexota bacterium]
MKERGMGGSSARFDCLVQEAVAETVQRQIDHGVDVVTDGEQSKPGFFVYIRERLAGFETMSGPAKLFEPEVRDFPEYYEQYFSHAMRGGMVLPMTPLACTGPVRYTGHEAIQRDIQNLKDALAGKDVAEVFMPSVAPGGVGANQYYRTQEEYLFAVADALHEEYQAIVNAGFLLQVDDPFVSDIFSYSDEPIEDQRRQAELSVEVVNHALRGIPADRVRFHTCYGINEGPRLHDAPLGAVLPTLLKVNAQAFSFEAANPRHEHEYHLFEELKLPDGVIVIPGVITHASNIVEHPELIAERLVRYARLVGKENVLAGADCGFSSQATYSPEVDPRVMWAKFDAMAEGAGIASRMLW